MNGATWTAAKSTSGPWSRLWARLHPKPGCAPDTRRSFHRGAILLVGAFGNRAALKTAKGRLLTAAFDSTEFLCVPEVEEEVGGFWAELYRPLCCALGHDPRRRQLTSFHAPDHAQTWMRQILMAGGGLLLVRSADRFPQACEIIYGAGGRVGFPPSEQPDTWRSFPVPAVRNLR